MLNGMQITGYHYPVGLDNVCVGCGDIFPCDVIEAFCAELYIYADILDEGHPAEWVAGCLRSRAIRVRMLTSEINIAYRKQQEEQGN